MKYKFTDGVGNATIIEAATAQEAYEAALLEMQHAPVRCEEVET